MFNSISGSSASSSASTSKGIGGLVSGLDTDTLVENLTAGTTAKIDKQKQQQQLVQWQKEAYRTLTKGLMEFNDKYFSSSSSTNITNSSFFELYQVNNLSEKVGLSGKLQNAQYVSVDEITQLATKSSHSYTTSSNNALASAIKINTGEKKYSNLDGQSLTVTAGGSSYTLKFDSEFGHKLQQAVGDGASQADISQKIEGALNRMIIDAGAVDSKGGAKIKASVSDDGVISFNTVDGSSSISVSGTASVMKQLGFGSETSVGGSGGTVKGSAAMEKVVKTATFAEQMSNKTIKFYLDGVTSTVTLGDYTGKSESDILTDVAEKINEQFKKDFGTRTETKDGDNKGKQVAAVQAKVETDTDGKQTISFNVTNGASSTFAIDSAGKFLLGKENGVFQVDPGTATKYNASMTLKEMNLTGLTSDGYGTLVLKAGATTTLKLDDNDTSTLSTTINVTNGEISAEDQKKLEDMGFKVSKGGTFGDQLVIKANDTKGFYATAADADAVDENQSDAIYRLNINDTEIMLNGSDSLNRIMNKVTQSEAGVTMTYSAVTGSMKLESKNFGAGKDITFGDSGIANTLFGADKIGAADADDIVRIAGQNSLVTLTVNGQSMSVERASNVITVDGLNIELKAKTDKDEDGKAIPITFDVALDSDTVVKNMKEFIETYNALISSINTAVTSKQDPDEKYEPLTDAQKENMSEDQIEKWEAKAKVAVLFNDSALKGIQQSLRSALYGMVNNVSASLSSVGITTGEWSKNGQLEMDEAKFRKALSENPERVTALFTQQSSIDYDIKNTTAQRKERYSESGLMYRFQDILKGAVGTGTPKGTLLQIAGIENDRTDGDNQLSDKLKNISEQITKLQKQLKTEQERYWKQFTSLETAIQNLNTQSSYITSMFE